MKPSTERLISGALLAAFGVYVLVRAWRLPITVDEAATAINHVPRLVVDTLFYETEANPNNHILHTLLAKIATGLFGWHHFAFRLPVLFGAVLYAWAAWSIAQRMSNNSWLKIFSLALFFGNPYMLEFFSLARGYGLAAGLMTVAIYQAWLFLESNEPQRLQRAFLFASLAVYANFTLLVFWAPFSCIMLFAAWQKQSGMVPYWKQIRPALVTLGVFVALWFVPLKRLSKDSEILNWNQLGTYFESIQRTVRAAIRANAYLGSQSDLTLTWLLFIGVVVIALVALWRWKENRFQLASDPRILTALLLPAAAFTNIVQVHLTHTPYLEARLALFYWPLLALALSAAAAWIWERFGRVGALAFVTPIALLWCVNTVRSVNFRQTFEWFHDSDTFTVMEYLKKTYEAEGRKEPYLFDTEWFMQNSFMYHLEKNTYGYSAYAKLPPFHGAQAPDKSADFYYAISADRIAEAVVDFDIVLRIPNSSLVLCRRKR